MRPRFWKYAGLYGVLALAMVPLMLGWVPPNRWYGFRLPGTEANPRLWYEINQIGGYLFFSAMAVFLGVNSLLLHMAKPELLRYLPLINAAMILIGFWLVTVELVGRLP